MATVKVKRTRKVVSPPSQEQFEEAFKETAKAITMLVEAAEAVDPELAIAISGTGGLLVGLWLELHRIADAVEAMNRYTTAN